MTFNRVLLLSVCALLLACRVHAQQSQLPGPDESTIQITEPVLTPSVTFEPAVPTPPSLTADTSEPESRGFIARVKKRFIRESDDSGVKDDPVGAYPRIGGLRTGAGIAVGAGFRTHVLDTPFYADVSGIVSTKWYVGIDGRLRWPSPAPRRLELWTTAKFRRFPQEDYFGVGNHSPSTARTDYAIHSSDLGGEVIVHVTRWLQIGTDAGYFRPKVASGTDLDFPSIEQRFTDATAPGLNAQPDYLHYGLTATVDYRDQPGHPRSGGFYSATLSTWDDRTLDQYSFRRFDGEVHQFIPLGTKRHVLVGRAGISAVNNAPGNRVPFYVYPYIGGASTVRSYRDYRFRDENVMSVGAEYRFELMKYVQLVAFTDAGQAARDWRDVSFRDLKKGYGGGVRAGTTSRTFLRVDVGTGGGEGTRVFLLFFPSF